MERAKKESFSKVQELEGVPDEMKAEIQDFFGKYKHVFLKTEQDGHFFEKLDNVLEQLFVLILLNTILIF